MNESKPILKNDDSSKDFIIKTLDGAQTHGFDIDSIYYRNGKWMIFEFLKCESKIMTPHTSHPRYYPYNWKKFISLYSIAEKLQADFYLVNYSDRDSDRNQVRLMKVSGIDKQALDRYRNSGVSGKCDYLIIDEDKKINYDEFKSWFQNLNQNAALPPF